MKKYISYISVWLMIIMFTACADETTNSIVQDEQAVVTLQLSGKTLATRAVIGTEAGEDAWNENVIKSVDCFLYPNGRTGEAAVFSVTGITVNATGTATIAIRIPNDKIEALFGMGNTCQAYVIANRPSASALGTDTSLLGLKKTVIEAEGFATQGSTVTPQESFVMDGEQVITLSADRKSITGHVDLYRAASKISLFITKVEETVIDEAGNKWISQPGNMRVFFHNGVKKAHVDVSADGCAYAVQAEDYFNFSLSGDTRGFEAVTAEDGGTEYYKHAPFYSYSSDWNTDKEHEAYLTLVVPWKKDGEMEFKPCYYQVPINVTNKKFERNNYYKIKLSVGILGDFDPDAPVELNPSYIIVDWGNGEVTADIKEYRYLVVDKNYVVMDNVNEVSIPFLTSHEVEMVNVKVTRPVLNPEDSDDLEITSGYTCEIKNGQIYYYKRLVNTNREDYVPYTITFTIKHKDMPNIKEDIAIMQYPALYVVADKNNGGNIVNDKNSDPDDKGYVYVYGNQLFSGSDWQVVRGCYDGGSSSNKNPNMYVINTSAFDSDSNYIIGDARSKIAVTGSSLGLSNSYNGKILQYYYPTNTEGNNAKNIIAPKFRIASSYGKCGSTISLSEAKKRCAAYQEYGYPAGRWRIPTTAELKYIAQLSSERKIPHLFSNEGYYWTATGRCRYYTNGTVSESTSTSDSFVRCVYDEWYWTDTVDKGTFTWGDKQR
ncbi:fimbrial protein [Phocaeicola sartorii]|uniref:fimbrial tip adhesin FimD n=1 Tax=Phocaeicola sartorii TaxID=671267 RepID=UPI00248CBE93|nr:fimbrial protein [Phocaeicola sartorii]